MDNPLVKEAITLAYGDSYRGFRVLGTTTDYLKKYEAQLERGRAFSHSMEATLGADLVEKTGLQLGDVFWERMLKLLKDIFMEITHMQ